MIWPGAGQRGSGPGWFADPLGPPGTLRWWDGRAWTARIVPDGAPGESISWSVTLRTLGAPETAPCAEAPIVVRAPRPLIDAPTDATPLAALADGDAEEPTERTVVAAPPIRFSADELPGDPVPVERLPVDPVPIAPVPVDPVPIAPVPIAPVPVDEPARTGRARRRLVPALVAAAFVALAAAAGAGILGGDDRPTVEPAIAYRDAGAGFSLRYPDAWQVGRETPGESVQFRIADPGASVLRTNLVTVRVGAEPADGESDALPALDELSSEVTTRLRAEHPGVELEEAARTRLAGAPALRLRLVDPGEVPPLRIEQYAGRTTTGRPLTVTITVREPRTAPTPEELREFLASVAPA